MSIVAKQLDGSRYHLLPQPRPHCVRWGPSSPKKEAQHPTFRPMSIVAKRSLISATAELLWKSDYRRHFLSMLYTVVVKNGPRHFGTWDGTVRQLGQDSSALRSELSLGHFGTSADLSGQFGPTRLVPNCLGSEASVIQSWLKTIKRRCDEVL